MDRSFEQFLKRISFFLLYLPALVYACQFAYFSGLTEPLGVSLGSLGMNYFEVTFLGYLNLSVGFLENFTKLMWIFIFIIIYLTLAAILHYFAVHPTERANEKQRIRAIIYSFEFNLPQYKANLKTLLNSYLGIILIYLSIFILSLLLILGFFTKGKNEINEFIKEVKTSKQSKHSTGYVSRDNSKYRTIPIVCGNNKCAGINLDKLEVITYLPENYSKNLQVEDNKI